MNQTSVAQLRNAAFITVCFTGASALAQSLAPQTALPLNAQSVASQSKPAASTTASVLAASTPADWRALDPENTLYLELATGRVVIEIAPEYAPAHAANVKALVREGYFDGLTINRVQDNYVAQWGDANERAARRVIKGAKAALPAEFDRAMSKDLPFTISPDGDTYAAEVGWSNGFAAARDPKSGRTWLTHCYGALGTARGNGADSGGGTQLFVIIGHAPRHLDRNDTAFGRVVKGMELLSTLPRGTGALGFYEKPEQRVAIKSIRVAADVPAAERTALQIMRTDTPTFTSYVESRRTRTEDWFKFPVGRIEVCNVSIPTR
ncbi:MAG: peptidylprolyl isomerase [Vicinamibacteria bacterium]